MGTLRRELYRTFRASGFSFRISQRVAGLCSAAPSELVLWRRGVAEDIVSLRRSFRVHDTRHCPLKKKRYRALTECQPGRSFFAFDRFVPFFAGGFGKGGAYFFHVSLALGVSQEG